MPNSRFFETKKSLHAYLLVVFVSIFYALTSHAQTVTGVANFGTVYAGAQINVPIEGTQTIGGAFTGGGTDQIAVGSITAPHGFNLTDTGQELMLPLTFLPNTTSGSMGGPITFSYTCEDDCTQGPSLTITIYLNGNSIVASATAGVKYLILATLYTAPGNASSSGFSNSVSSGASTSISQNFSDTDSITFGGGFLGTSNSVTFSTGISYGDSSSFSTSYQATAGDQLKSVSQAIDHTQDQMYLLVDPSVTVNQTGESSGSYFLGPSLDATGSFGSGGTPPDIMNTNIAGFETPSSIPLQYLEPQVPIPGTTLPGLSIICANPLPASECTQQNACGCTSADFAQIVSTDELANITDQSIQPSSIDPARYVYVDYEPLEGPEQEGAGPVSSTYSVSDSSMNSESTSNGTSYSVGYSHNFDATGLFSLSIKVGNTFTYSQKQTAGTSNGTAHTATVTLGTSDVGCEEYVDIYEDTIYHTFAYALSQPAPADCQ